MQDKSRLLFQYLYKVSVINHNTEWKQFICILC